MALEASFTDLGYSWYQTSRPGYNLVLQINFDWAHDHDYYRLIAPDNNKDLPFVYDGHPVATKRNTLSWARIDVGLAYDEALIEEIQTDWLREVKQTASDVAKSATNEDQPLKKILWYWKGDATVRSFNDYYHKMQPYFKLWDEATLAASIWFLKRELGINNIYYNTYETGNFMKRLHYNKPPRSLYTQLPRQFGFRETAEAPHFLEDEPYLKKTFRNNSVLKWYVLKF